MNQAPSFFQIYFRDIKNKSQDIAHLVQNHILLFTIGMDLISGQAGN